MEKNNDQKRQRRKLHIRKTLSGTSAKPRIFVFKSNRYFYAGLADDDKNIVLKSLMCKRKGDAIKKMAKDFAKIAGKFDSAVFDRSGYRYHGLIALFAEELRSNGIKI